MAQPTDYNHRSAVQKLGIKPSERVEITGDVGSGLRKDVKDTLGRGLVRSGELDGPSSPSSRSRRPKRPSRATGPRLRDTGYLWFITPKRGQDGYVEPDAARPRRQASAA